MFKRFGIRQDQQLGRRALCRPRLAPQRGGVTTAAQQEYAPAYHSPPPAAAAPPPAAEDEGEDDTPVAPPAPVQDGRRLSEVAREAALTAERAVISDTLRQVHWNRRKAAQILGVSYKTLLNKIKETGIERP
jgi:DNA-binding NtrC family response regulator